MKTIDSLIRELLEFKIDHSDLNNCYKKIKSIYFEMYREHLSEVKHHNLKKGTKLFRVRKNVQNLLYSRPAEFSYPPVHLTNFGRVNLCGVPLYYCADHDSTAILEIKPLENEFVTLSESTLLEDQNLAVIGHCSRYKTAEVLSESLNKFYDFTTALTNRNIENPNDYLLSAILGHVMLSDQSHAGLIYPSIYANGYADNIALRTEISSKKLQFNSARQFQVVKRIDANHLIIKCIAASDKIASNGILIWTPVNNCNNHEIHFDAIKLSIETV